MTLPFPENFENAYSHSARVDPDSKALLEYDQRRAERFATQVYKKTGNATLADDYSLGLQYVVQHHRREMVGLENVSLGLLGMRPGDMGREALQEYIWHTNSNDGGMYGLLGIMAKYGRLRLQSLQDYIVADKEDPEQSDAAIKDIKTKGITLELGHANLFGYREAAAQLDKIAHALPMHEQLGKIGLRLSKKYERHDQRINYSFSVLPLEEPTYTLVMAVRKQPVADFVSIDDPQGPAIEVFKKTHTVSALEILNEDDRYAIHHALQAELSGDDPDDEHSSKAVVSMIQAAGRVIEHAAASKERRVQFGVVPALASYLERTRMGIKVDALVQAHLSIASLDPDA